MRPYLVVHMEAEGLLSLAGVDGCLFSSDFFLLSRPEPSLPLRLKPFHSLLSAPTIFFLPFWLMRSSSVG